MCASAVSSQALEESNSVLNEKALRQFFSLRTICMLRQFSGKTGRKYLSMEILRRSTGKRCLKLTSSQVDSLARMRVGRIVEERELKEKELVSGNISRKPYAFCDLSTLSLKTFQTCLNGDFQNYSVTLPKSGMMRNGELYELVILEHPISERDSLLLPTLCAGNHRGFGWTRKKRSSTHITRFPSKIWMPGKTNYPNPHYWEWALGFPRGWTELNASEIQSYRKLRNTLREQLKGRRD